MNMPTYDPDSNPFEESIDIDLNAPDPSLEAGVDVWQVDAVKKDVSKSSGAPMLVMTLSRVRRSTDKIIDRIMLAGNGYDMGRQKLAAFLAPGYKGQLRPSDLVNVRVWANTEVSEYQGRSKLEVKPKDGFPNAGYLPWDKDGPVPPGGVQPEPTPF